LFNGKGLPLTTSQVYGKNQLSHLAF